MSELKRYISVGRLCNVDNVCELAEKLAYKASEVAASWSTDVRRTIAKAIAMVRVACDVYADQVDEEEPTLVAAALDAAITAVNEVLPPFTKLQIRTVDGKMAASVVPEDDVIANAFIDGYITMDPENQKAEFLFVRTDKGEKKLYCRTAHEWAPIWREE